MTTSASEDPVSTADTKAFVTDFAKVDIRAIWSRTETFPASAILASSPRSEAIYLLYNFILL